MRKVLVVFMAGLALLLLAACSPTGGEVGITPDPTLPAAPTTAATPPTLPTTEATPTTAAPSATATPTGPAEATAAPAASLDEFINQFKLAVTARDFTALEGMMADPFTVGYWLSEGVTLSPDEAAAELGNLLPTDAQIVWADAGTDLTQMLQGQPPAAFLGPGREVAAALLSYGWGEDAAGEAIQFITQRPDGGYQWELMLYSGFGFAGMPTTVEAVVINADEATFYSGPGTEYEPVATVAGGLPYPVISASQDNGWWRLRCYDDNNALIPSCWVSADPAVTSPTSLP